MQIQMAFAYDHAAEYDNALSVLGSFNVIKTSKLPVTKRQCTYVIQIRWCKKDKGKHLLKVNFSDAHNKKTLKNYNTIVNVESSTNTLMTITTHMIHFQNLSFKAYGMYTASVLVDNKVIAQIPIQIAVPNLDPDQLSSLFYHHN